MSGPTPITAPYRLTFQYTVDSLAHKARFYCDAHPSADPSGFDVSARGGSPAQGVSTLGNAFFLKAAPFYNVATSSFDSWLLEVRSGTTWLFATAGAITQAPTGAGLVQIANALAITGRATDNSQYPRYIFEGTFGSSDKFTALGALNANARALVNYYYNPDATASATAAYFWALTRGGAFAQRWLAFVIDTNEKLRRLRRIK
jgi:hypothetical protein